MALCGMHGGRLRELIWREHLLVHSGLALGEDQGGPAGMNATVVTLNSVSRKVRISAQDRQQRTRCGSRGATSPQKPSEKSKGEVPVAGRLLAGEENGTWFRPRLRRSAPQGLPPDLAI